MLRGNGSSSSSSSTGGTGGAISGASVISVRDGMALRVGDFVVRYAELFAGGSVAWARGTVCEIVYQGGGTLEVQIGDAVREVWGVVGAGVGGVRAYDDLLGVADGEGREDEDEARRWMRGLRLKDGQR